MPNPHKQPRQLKLTEFMFVAPWPFLAAWPTFFSPALWPFWLCLSLCGQIHLAPSYLLSGHSTTLLREKRFTVYHGCHFDAYTYCCTTGQLWRQRQTNVNNGRCQNPQFLYVKNNLQVLVIRKRLRVVNIAAALIIESKDVALWSYNLPIYRFGLFAWRKGSFNYCLIYIK